MKTAEVYMPSRTREGNPLPAAVGVLSHSIICKLAPSRESGPFASYGLICPVTISVVLVGVMNLRRQVVEAIQKAAYLV
jgi:hypothetical protein